MSDSTYMPAIYKDQGGNRMTVGPLGTLVIEGIVSGPSTTGQNFFVDATNGASGNAGTSPGAAKATLLGAVALCTAGRGDRIYLMPGHAENIAAATSLSVAGVEIIGLGKGNLIPTISCTNTAGTIGVDAANITIQNVRLTANVAGGVASAITIAAAGDGCTLNGVQCRDTTSDKEFVVHVSVATTVTDLAIRNCSFVGLAGGSMTNSVLFAGTSTDALIENTYIFVDSADDVVDHLAGASVNFVARYNVIVNADTGAAGYCLRYKSDGTGIAYGNFFCYANVAAEISVGAAAWWMQNYASNTIAESGLLDPTTSHAIP